MTSNLNLNIKSLTNAYQALTSTSNKQTQSHIINTLPEGLKSRIKNLISSNPSYSKERAVHEIAMEEFEVLEDPNLKNRLYVAFYRAIGVSSTAYPRWGEQHIRDFDRADIAFKVFAEELDVKFLDIEPILNAFEAEMSKDLMLAALDELSFFNFQTPIPDELDSRIIELLSNLKRSSETPTSFDIKKSIIIERVTQVLKKIDIKEWSDFDHLLIRDTLFDPIGVACTTEQETLNLPQLQARFNEALNQIEAKEPRLSDTYDKKREADWDARKASWEKFKERIKTYPAATLFDNTNGENRQRQYYTLGLRFVAAALKTDSEDSLGFCLDHIDRAGEDSFLETCLTGWSVRISQLESVSGVNAQDPLVRVWEISKEVRRNLLDRYISENFPGGNVHAYEQAKAAVNKPFNLGYSKDDLGAENEGENKLDLNFVDLNLYIENHFVANFLGALEAELKKKSPEEIELWFSSLLEAYRATAVNDPSLLIDPSAEGIQGNIEILCEKLQTNEKFAAIVLGILSKSLKIKHHEESKVQGVILSWMQTLDLSSSFKNNSTFLNEPYSGLGLLEDIRTESLKNVFIYLKNETLSSNEWLAALKLSLELGNDTLINLLVQTKDVLNLTEEEKESLANLDYQSAFKLASSTSKVALVPCLSVLFRENMDKTIEQFIIDGKIELVEFLLSKKIQISDKTRSGALNYAVYFENLNMLRLLLPEDVQISVKIRSSVVKSAVYQNKLELVHCLLPKGAEISMEARGEALEIAAQNRNASMVHYLLSEGAKITAEARGKAVLLAAENSNLEMMDYLLSEGAEISMAVREEAFELAADNSDIKMVKLLLPEGCEISMGIRGRAFILAAYYEDLELLKLLLPQGVEISEQRWINAIGIATSRNNLDMLDWLLPMRVEFSIQAREMVLCNAVEYGNLEIVELLLRENSEISSESRGFAVHKAALKNDLDMLRLLLPHGAEISSESRGLALFEAASYKNKDMIRYLLPHGIEISMEARGKAVKIVALSNDLEIIRLLQPEGAEIHTNDRGRAVAFAAHHDNLEMICYLLPEGAEIPMENRDEAVISAAKNSNIEMIRYLLPEGVEISTLAREEAIEMAAIHNNLDILDCLRR